MSKLPDVKFLLAEWVRYNIQFGLSHYRNCLVCSLITYEQIQLKELELSELGIKVETVSTATATDYVATTTSGLRFTGTVEELALQEFFLRMGTGCPIHNPENSDLLTGEDFL
ncbi:MAG: hypothetical protein HXX08_11285 [Chloroflexi bacterium]|uniref:Uncharacterized protein n=1 Tax=Candidatus Chlorohelix allophototropha TaxID=3003348 RepID=A0A8T7M0V2_9CHLR|nr:hypothetical protein [Chloroflexota bacterium]WJW65820.1 hypothetical protein OZ401_001599 [Chloroflexota bacterium L227-S17]